MGEARARRILAKLNSLGVGLASLEARVTKPRTKIKHNDTWYKPVPWLKEGECDGCAMNTETYRNQCYNQGDGEPCSDGGEFEGKIFIRFGKEALAEYIATKLST
jgi:hypothetical protein